MSSDGQSAPPKFIATLAVCSFITAAAMLRMAEFMLSGLKAATPGMLDRLLDLCLPPNAADVFVLSMMLTNTKLHAVMWEGSGWLCVLYVGLAVVSILVGVGLWRMQAWARWTLSGFCLGVLAWNLYLALIGRDWYLLLAYRPLGSAMALVIVVYFFHDPILRFLLAAEHLVLRGSLREGR
jgi:hypothetical protein